jgi:hypothetical protein
MTPDAVHHVVAPGLSELTRLAPDSDRAERVRSQCRTQLERRWRRQTSAATSTGRAWRLLTPVIVGSVCVLYALALAATTLRLEGIL